MCHRSERLDAAMSPLADAWDEVTSGSPTATDEQQALVQLIKDNWGTWPEMYAHMVACTIKLLASDGAALRQYTKGGVTGVKNWAGALRSKCLNGHVTGEAGQYKALCAVRGE